MFKNNFPPKHVVDALRREYPVGAKVKMISINDPYTHIPAGTLGTVQAVDDIGTIFCRWDNGFSLGVIHGEDRIEKVN